MMVRFQPEVRKLPNEPSKSGSTQATLRCHFNVEIALKRTRAFGWAYLRQQRGSSS